MRGGSERRGPMPQGELDKLCYHSSSITFNVDFLEFIYSVRDGDKSLFLSRYDGQYQYYRWWWYCYSGTAAAAAAANGGNNKCRKVCKRCL